jgi:sulfur relay (sulfurtransferase) DsrC/TusE family protein
LNRKNDLNQVVKLPTKTRETLSNEVWFLIKLPRGFFGFGGKTLKKHLVKQPSETVKTLSNEGWFLIKLPRGFFFETKKNCDLKQVVKLPTKTVKTLSNEVWFLIKLPRDFFGFGGETLKKTSHETANGNSKNSLKRGLFFSSNYRAEDANTEFKKP